LKFDLKTPCKNCPFRSDATRITFACRERAEEIAEQAYRHGFPCHLSADYVEDDDTFDGESGGFVFGEKTQHCVGAIIMFLKDGHESGWPGIDNDEELAERLAGQVDLYAPVFDSEEEFIEANP
jgi:hypothetical protein